MPLVLEGDCGGRSDDSAMQVSGLGLGLGLCLAIAMALFCVCLEGYCTRILFAFGGYFTISCYLMLSHLALVIFHIISANEMGDFDYYLLY